MNCRKRTWLVVTACCVAGALPPATGLAQAVKSEILPMESGERCLRQEIVIDAPLIDVWRAFTTEDGMERWLAPVVEVDFRLGGQVRTHYNPKAEIGHPGTVTLRYVNYVPQRLLTLQAELDERWPEEVRLAAPNLYNVIEFERVGRRRTRLVSWGLGYGTSEVWDQMIQFFIQGNEWSYGVLATSFRDGPVDWTAIEVPGTSTEASDETAEP